MIKVELKGSEVFQASLRRLIAGVEDQSEVMEEIGQWLMVSAKRNFEEGKGPDGTPWAKNSPVTLARKSDPRPLMAERNLYDTISFDSGRDYAEVGSGKAYAGMMQFGGAKSAFPHLWGDIPARPFIGIGEDDEFAILHIVTEWLARIADG